MKRKTSKMPKKTLAFVLFILMFTLTISSSIAARFLDQNISEIKNENSVFTDSTQYDLLIIAPGRYSKQLQPLIKHKNQIGITTKLVTLAQVYKQTFWEGRDQPEKIKYFIKNAIEHWNITYVLLIGDYRQLPVRYCYNDFEDDLFTEPRFISDLYYADIYDKQGNFSSWDTNNNGIYGEWKGEEAQDKNIDLYPDVYLGRLACKNRLEVKTVVNKIITYETSTYNQSWFKNMVAVAGDTYPHINNISEGEEATQQAIDYMDGFNPIKLWASNGELITMGGLKILKTINKGCGFIYFAGHGNPPFWITNPHNESEGEGIGFFSILHIRFLTNGYKLPVCIAPGCGNSMIDVSPLNIFKSDDYWYIRLNKWNYISECWSWQMVRKPGGGAIATIGSTGIGCLKEDENAGGTGAWSYLATQFFWEYSVNSKDILGEMWAKTTSDHLNEFPINWSTPSMNQNRPGSEPDAVNARTVQQCLLLGDPSLKIGGYNIKEEKG